MNLEALRALEKAVEAGGFPLTWAELNAAGVAHNSYGLDCRGYAWEAFHGSMDAAKALHDAVLPGWHWNIVLDSATLWPKFPGDPRDVVESDAIDGQPARAWLLAIIRVLIAQAEAKGVE